MVACRQLRRDAVDFTGVDHLLISMKIAVPAAAGWRIGPAHPAGAGLDQGQMRHQDLGHQTVEFLPGHTTGLISGRWE